LSLGKNNNEGLSKDREDGIAKSSRNIMNSFECIIMKECVSKHREEGIAKESRNMLIMNVCVYVSFWLYVFYVRMCLVSFVYVTLVFVRFGYLWLGFVMLVTFGYFLKLG
jgi:hypothetical protein